MLSEEFPEEPESEPGPVDLIHPAHRPEVGELSAKLSFTETQGGT